jgi:carboxypeptidase Q
MRRLFRRLTAPVAAALIFSLLVGAQSPGTAPAAGEEVNLEVMSKIRAEGLERSQVMDTLGYLTDVYGPRLTGSPQLKAAGEWAVKRLSGWGLRNGKLEAWGEFGRGWTLERFAAHVIEPTPFPLIALPKAWTPGTNGPLAGEPVIVDLQSEADFERYKGKLKGAFVMLGAPREVKAHFKPEGTRLTEEELLSLATDGQRGGNSSPEARERFRKGRAFALKRTEFLKQEGVAVIIDPGRVGDGGTIFVQGGGSYDKKDAAVPSVVVAVEHYGRIHRLLQKGVKVKVELNIQVKFHDADRNAYNVIAETPGTDPKLKDEIVMLGGHLDSWHGGTGATDNAAGCAVAMEAVRILKALGVQPRRTIRIALWSGEEQGLLGSRAYVKKHFGERKLAPGQSEMAALTDGGARGPLATKPDHAKFSAYFNLDSGTGKIRGVYLQGNEAVRPIFRAWLAPLRDLGAATLTINGDSGTDHLAFDAVELPGFNFIQDEIEYETRTHHSNMDTYERIQPDDLKQASVIMAAFVYNAAMRDEKLPRKPLPAPAPQQAGQ